MMILTKIFTIIFFLFFVNINYSQYYTKLQIITIDNNKLASEGDMYLDTINKDYFIGLTNGRVGSLTEKVDSIQFINDTSLVFYWNFKELDTVNMKPFEGVIKTANVITKTTNYTLNQSDLGAVFRFNGTSPMTLTIPSGLPIGYNISVYQVGTGQVTIIGGGGVSVKNRLSIFRTAGLDAGVGIMATDTDVFHITGDLTK